MKAVHPSYTFVASTKTITLTGLNIDQDQLLLIVNATRGVQYFNFADSLLRGTVTPGANTTVVLTDASTTGHSNSDALVIYYDDQAAVQAVSGTVTANPGTGAFTVSGTVGLDNASLVALENITVTVSPAVLGTVTISNLPATQTVAGTVTAKIDGIDPTVIGNGGSIIQGIPGPDQNAVRTVIWSVDTNSDIGQEVGPANPLPISGTVTANVTNSVTVGSIVGPIGGSVFKGNSALTDAIRVLPFFSQNGAANYNEISTSNALPVSGTVTVGAMPSGALTTRFGSVVTANLATLTSAVTNTSRKYLLVQNIATSTVTIGIGFAPTTTQGIQLTAGAGLTFDAFCPTGGVWWLSSTTGSNFSILEG